MLCKRRRGSSIAGVAEVFENFVVVVARGQSAKAEIVTALDGVIFPLF